MTKLNIAILTLVAVSTATVVTLPSSHGDYGTASTQMQLTDHSRRDPYALASGNSQPRRVMVSSFYPVAPRKDCTNYNSPYMPNATAAFYDDQFSSYGIPANTFSSLDLVSCNASANKINKQPLPVILFSPGLGNSRLIYSAMAQELASAGYIVITIDHPYDADIVEFPNGEAVYAANITTDAQVEAALNVRVQDASFVIDQLQARRSSAKQLLGGHACSGAKQYAFYGHSLGGATAAAATLSDSRISGAVNLDGSFFGPILSLGAKKPLLILAHEGKNFTTDPSWASTWNATQGSTKVAVGLADTAHGSYTDYPLIVDALGITGDLRGQLAGLIGAVSGVSVRDVVGRFVAQFVEYSQCREKMPLIDLGGSGLEGVQLLGDVGRKRCR